MVLFDLWRGAVALSHMGEIETLLKLYKERRMSKEKFIARAPFGVPKDAFSDLIDDYDAGVITDEEFISIARGMMAIPPTVERIAPPPEVDLLEQWDIFERTKSPLVTKSRLDSYRLRIKPFLEWLTERGIPANEVKESTVMEYIHWREEEYDEKYKASYVQTIRREIKIFFGWLEAERVFDLNPLRRMKIKKLKGSPETFHIKVEHGKLVFSEMNPIYEALFTHPNRFNDWRRVELEIRLMRETGLRGEHARLLQFGDINLEIKDYEGIPCGGVISYARIEPFKRPPKYMPTIPTPISPLFGKRLETYFKMHPEVGLEDSIIYQAARGVQKKLKKLRTLSGVPYTVTPKKFRKAFATLLVNIEPKAAIWSQLTGDDVGTLTEYYADRTLAITYSGMGLKGYADIVNLIFASEGMLEEEIQPKRPVGRPRRKQAFILPM